MKASPKTAKSDRERFYPAIFLFATALVYLLPSARAILDDGDALYAQIAEQMNSRSDWVTPYANGVRFLDKPPLMFWLMAASYRVFGVHEWAARLPTALGIAGTAWLLWVMGRRAAGAGAGLFAALAFVLSAGTLFFTLEAFPDIFLVFFLTLAVYCLLRWHGDGGESVWPTIGFFAALGGAVLAKSLIGIVFPLAIAVLFLSFSRPRPRIRFKGVVVGFLVLLAIAGPWHLLAALRNPGFLEHYFVNEQLLRFFGRRQPVDYGSIPIPIFWALILVWFFPWSSFLAAVVKLGKTLGDNVEARAVVRLAVCWGSVVVVFFSLASRLEHYSFPAIPPLALLVGIAIAQSEVAVSKWIDRGFAFLGAFGVLSGIASVAVFIWWGLHGAALVADDGARVSAYTNLFSPLFDLPAATRARLVSPLLGTLVLFACGTVVAWWWNRRGGRMRGVLALAATMTAFCLIATYSLGLCEGLLSSRAFGVVLRERALPGASVVVMGDYESANSISFYAPVRLLILGGSAASLEQGLRYDGSAQMIISRDRLEGLWQGPDRVFLLGRMSDVSSLGIAPAFIIADYSGRRLISNR
ncbi:MAG: glycosyltransferase family 39 protein [Acidobacteriota bacterium]